MFVAIPLFKLIVFPAKRREMDMVRKMEMGRKIEIAREMEMAGR